MKFQPRQSFSGLGGYRLLPLRFRHLPWGESHVLVSSMSDNWLIAKRDDFERAVMDDLHSDDLLFADIKARCLIASDVRALGTFSPYFRVGFRPRNFHPLAAQAASPYRTHQ